MSLEQKGNKVTILRGPDGRGNHVGSTVVATDTRTIWISTVDLERTPRSFETLIFPVPTDTKLVKDENEKPSFSKDFDLEEVRSGEIPGVSNITNMP